jgi:hypothetical protein
MATIELRKSEMDDDSLPNVCMCCGDEAITQRQHTFLWRPMEENVGQVVAVLLRAAGFIVLRFSDNRSMTVKVPLCGRHKRHFLWPALLQYLGLLVFMLLGLLVVLAALNGPDSMDEMKRQALGLPQDNRVWLLRGAMVLFVGWPIVWLAAVVSLQWNSIRPIKITDTNITLTNVSEEFIDEMKRRP